LVGTFFARNSVLIDGIIALPVVFEGSCVALVHLSEIIANRVFPRLRRHEVSFITLFLGFHESEVAPIVGLALLVL
jgi:hypothetical protein